MAPSSQNLATGICLSAPTAPLVLSLSVTNPRFSVVAHDLRERIAAGDFGDTGALESEAALGEHYKVSRVTVRRALELLRSEGLLESRRGSGWFVTGSSFSQPLALGTFRHAPSAVTAAGQLAERTVVEYGLRNLPATPAEALHLRPGQQALHARSVRRVNGVPLDITTEWVPAQLTTEITRDQAQDPGLWETLQKQGEQVTLVRQRIGAGVASASAAQQLEVPLGTPLLLVRRLALGVDGSPIALAQHRYLAHRFSLEVEFRGWSSAVHPDAPGLMADH